MSSISVSDYRTHFQEFVEEVAKRPSMYVRNLAELQLLLLGYEAAFRAVVGGHSDAFFHRQFSDWLMLKKGWSLAGGWATAMAEAHPSFKLSELIEEFRHLLSQFVKEKW